MRAGSLRHKIVIQQKTISTDSHGGPVSTWSTYATVWARKSSVSGRELIVANAEKGQITVRFTVRYLSGVTHEMRIAYGDKFYDIKYALPDERMRELQILTTEGMTEG